MHSLTPQSKSWRWVSVYELSPRIVMKFLSYAKISRKDAHKSTTQIAQLHTHTHIHLHTHIRQSPRMLQLIGQIKITVRETLSFSRPGQVIRLY